MRKRYEALILDIDGTMVRTGIDWSLIRKKLREILGLDLPPYPIAEYLSRHSNVLPQDRVHLAEELVKEEELRSALSVERDPRLTTLIKDLKNSGYSIAVVTLRDEETARLVLERLGCLCYVDLVVTREVSTSRVEQLKEAIRLLRTDPKGVLFFGDHFTDCEAANKLNIDYILIPKRDDVKGVPPELASFLYSLL